MVRCVMGKEERNVSHLANHQRHLDEHEKSQLGMESKKATSAFEFQEQECKEVGIEDFPCCDPEVCTDVSG